MGTLSNFLRRANGAAPAPAAPGPPLSCRPAAREQVHPALRIVLGAGGRLAPEGAVVDFLQFAVQRGIDLNDLWVAERAGRVVWAMLPIVSPGRTMLVIVPGGEAKDESGADAAGTLAEAVCEHFGARGVLMAQMLVDPSDNAGQDAYLRRGFRRMAELIYLSIDVRRATLPADAAPPGCEWSTYSAETHPAFAATIVESYRDSLDCPALNGLRDVEDVIAGHKSSGGAFDPAWWFLLREHGRPVATLLLARTANNDAAELVYLGLVPAARGRGLADLVMRRALHAVAHGGCASLALAVDAGNGPALRLYHRHGLRRVGSKVALMRQLRTGARRHAERVDPEPGAALAPADAPR